MWILVYLTHGQCAHVQELFVPWILYGLTSTFRDCIGCTMHTQVGIALTIKLRAW